MENAPLLTDRTRFSVFPFTEPHVRKLTSLQTIFSVATFAIGSTIVTLPKNFSRLGWYSVGLLILAVLTVIHAASIQLKVQAVFREGSTPDVANKVFGKSGYFAVGFLQLAVLFLIAVVYIGILSQKLAWLFFREKSLFWDLLGCLFILPFTFMKNMNFFEKLTPTVSIGYIVLLLLLLYGSFFSSKKLDEISSQNRLPLPLDVGSCLCLYLIGFYACPAFCRLQNASISDTVCFKNIVIAHLICFTVYLLFCGIPYFFFSTAIPDDVSDIFSGYQAYIFNICLLYILLMCLPNLVFGCAETLKNFSKSKYLSPLDVFCRSLLVIGIFIMLQIEVKFVLSLLCSTVLPFELLLLPTIQAYRAKLERNSFERTLDSLFFFVSLTAMICGSLALSY